MRPAIYSVAGFKAAYVLAQFIPRRWALWLGRSIALASYDRRPAARVALRENLRRTTDLHGLPLDALCRKNVANFGHMLADYFRCIGPDGGPSALTLLDEWRGIEHVNSAHALGRGTIIVTAHLGHWEMGGVLLALRGLRLTVVTLEEPSTALTRWRDNFRRQLGIKTIAVGPGREFAFIELVRVLRENECLAMLVDRPYPGSGTGVDFFGARADFSTAPALLAHHTGAAVVPAFVLLNERGHYVSFADQAIPMDSTGGLRGSMVPNTQRLATTFEAIIRRHPEQWFNYVPIWKSESPSAGR